MLVIGVGGGELAFAFTENLSFRLANVALATVVGIIFNSKVHLNNRRSSHKGTKGEKGRKKGNLYSSYYLLFFVP
jgi:hypothetical protein